MIEKGHVVFEESSFRDMGFSSKAVVDSCTKDRIDIEFFKVDDYRYSAQFNSDMARAMIDVLKEFIGIGSSESVWKKRIGHRIVFDVRKITGSCGRCDYYDAVVVNNLVGSGGEELVLLRFDEENMLWTRVVGDHLETSDKVFKQCLDMGFLTGGKRMKDYDMEDLPREVWDEVYEKWERALDIGWSTGMWTGCRVCTWMAGSLEIAGMGGDACALCPLYKDEWCRSFPSDSLINPCYAGDVCGGDDWETRVRTFLTFIKPYCSSDEKGDGEDY